jgi:phosphopentomutase
MDDISKQSDIPQENSTQSIESVLANMQARLDQVAHIISVLTSTKSEVQKTIVTKPMLQTIEKAEAIQVSERAIATQDTAQVDDGFKAQIEIRQAALESKQSEMLKELEDKEIKKNQQEKIKKYSDILNAKKLSEDLILSTDSKVLDEIVKDLKVLKNIRHTAVPVVPQSGNSLTAEQKAFASLFDKGAGKASS